MDQKRPPGKGQCSAQLSISDVSAIVDLTVSLQDQRGLQRAVHLLPLGDLAVQQAGQAGNCGRVRLLAHRRNQRVEGGLIRLLIHRRNDGVQGGLVRLLYHLVGQGFQRRVKFRVVGVELHPLDRVGGLPLAEIKVFGVICGHNRKFLLI